MNCEKEKAMLRSVIELNVKGSHMAGVGKLLLENQGILRAELIFTITGDTNALYFDLWHYSVA